MRPLIQVKIGQQDLFTLSPPAAVVVLAIRVFKTTIQPEIVAQRISLKQKFKQHTSYGTPSSTLSLLWVKLSTVASLIVDLCP